MSLISKNCPTLEKISISNRKCLVEIPGRRTRFAHPNEKLPDLAIHHSPQPPALCHIFTDFLLVFVLGLQKHSHQEKPKSAGATRINYKDRCFCNKTLLPNQFILELKRTQSRFAIQYSYGRQFHRQKNGTQSSI